MEKSSLLPADTFFSTVPLKGGEDRKTHDPRWRLNLTMNGTNWLRLGAILSGLAVAGGAFAAHGLEDRLDSRGLALFETAARYQMYHALALLAVGLLAGAGRAHGALGVAGWSFALGIALFSGSLYALAVTGIKWLGAITPIGGVLFLVGWAALAAHRAGRAAPSTPSET
jgi:uncharacterized membrane protein YgdD (TMEM256/DUF423 family)